MRVMLGIALAAALASPAAAEWQIRTSGTTAGAWTTNADGTSLALSCDQFVPGEMRLEISVVPTEAADGAAAPIYFEVGGQVIEAATEAYLNSRGRVQILRGQMDYAGAAAAQLRARLRAGNVVTLPGQPHFETAQFRLNGSGRAIGRLEEACPDLWD